jgi:FkbM family methyltransferase
MRTGLDLKSALLRIWLLTQRLLLPLGLSHSRKLGERRIYFDPATDIGIHLTVLGHFEKPALEVCARYIRPDSVILDIGANIGTHTLAFAQLVPQGLVFSFEPARSTFALLLRNLRGLQNVIPLNLALSDTSGVLPFFVAGDNAYSSLKDTRRRPIIGKEQVSCLRADEILPHLVGERRIDFVKIDVEGFELQVLQGMREILRRHRPVIFCEILSSEQLQNPDPEGTVRFCTSLGYEACILDGATLKPAGAHNDSHYNYFFIPSASFRGEPIE